VAILGLGSLLTVQAWRSGRAAEPATEATQPVASRPGPAG
jgi:hypothetical protein